MNRSSVTNIVFLILNILACVFLIISYRAIGVDPVDNSTLPIFGLAYPLLLMVNIGFIILWFIRKTTWFVMSLVCIIIGFGVLSDFFQINFYEETKPLDGEIKILTYNVRLFGYYDEDEGAKRDEIFKYLVDEAADVMCFQEFYYTENKKGFITRDSLLKIQDAQYLHEKYTHEFRHKQNFGVVTLSKHPIVFKGYIPFDGDINNFCIYSDIALPTRDTIRVYNAHLASIRFQKQDYDFISGEGNEAKNTSSFDGGKRILNRLQSAFIKRSRQVDKVLANIATSPYPTFFAGDFNDNPSSNCYSKISDHLNDAFLTKGNGTGHTYNGVFPALRIDYIFHDDNVECLDFNVFREDLSDHFSINARFKIIKPNE